ncbi:MAG: N,N-dimethylformamidase beta subunit family domain-containing protein [Acetobacteraceae bacterium]
MTTTSATANGSPRSFSSWPQDWQSGVYALHLEAGSARDNIVFYVRAARPGVAARVAFLAPTMTYTIYGQYIKAGRQALNAERAAAWGSLPHAPDGHPGYGVSPYNFHSDGSGVGMASMRRPMIDKRGEPIPPRRP